MKDDAVYLSGLTSSVGSVAEAASARISIYEKLEPLLVSQSALNENLHKINDSWISSTASLDHLGEQLTSGASSVRSLSLGLSDIGRIAAETRALFKPYSYDFLDSPLTSTLSVAVDTIKTNQNRLILSAEAINNALGETEWLVPSHINQITSLSVIALESLQQSSVFLDFVPPITPMTVVQEEIDIIKNRVLDLEKKIDKIDEDNTDSLLTDITKNVVHELRLLDPDLASQFNGALTTLIANESEDVVAQVSESLVRVIENLPFVLVGDMAFISVHQKDKVAEALGSYLGLTEDERRLHYLVLLQASFYTTLSDIRHRNPTVYKPFNNDKKRFRAFVVQIEAYIYQLITIKL